MIYCVTYYVEGRYTMCVEADSLEEAMHEAQLDFMDADLNEGMEIVESKPVTVVDERDIVWEE